MSRLVACNDGWHWVGARHATIRVSDGRQHGLAGVRSKGPDTLPVEPRNSARNRFANWRGDLTAAGVLLLSMGVALAFWLRRDAWLSEYDILSYFLPWFGETGEQLRAGDLPRWMPWLSGGSPLAGDPSGGWWYVPVMGAFAAFPVVAAFKAMVLVQTVIGGLATYVLGRLLGHRPVAALVAAAAYVLGPFLASQRMYGTVAGQASTWVPVAFVGIEMAVRTPRWVAKFAWCGLAGFAISQIAVSWPGQGLVNSLSLSVGGSGTVPSCGRSSRVGPGAGDCSTPRRSDLPCWPWVSCSPPPDSCRASRRMRRRTSRAATTPASSAATTW